MKVLFSIAGLNRNVGGPAVTVPSLAEALAGQGGQSLTPSPIADLLERGCVQSTSRSTLGNSVAADELQPASPAKLLRLVCDTAAPRGPCTNPSSQRVETSILTLDYPWEGDLPTLRGARLISVKRGHWTRRLGGWCPEFRHQLDQLAQQGLDLIHNHGLWLFPNCYARQVAVAHKLPLVISPRGMLEDWSLRRSRAKKRLVWHLMERRNLSAAAAFHATSQSEADAIRRLGCQQPIAVIPNGVELPEATMPGREVLEARFPELRDQKWLLFMSRLHPKKGLLELAGVWGRLTTQFPDWRLVIAGPDEGGFQREVQSALTASGGDRRALFTGPLEGDDKSAALANAELFVLPTHSENFGVVVAEALAHGCPAVVTKGAPWSELVSARCGWWVELADEVLFQTLSQAMKLPGQERRTMGERGRRLVADRYSWSRAAAEMREFYAWLLGRGPKPGCVTLGG